MLHTFLKKIELIQIIIVTIILNNFLFGMSKPLMSTLPPVDHKTYCRIAHEVHVPFNEGNMIEFNPLDLTPKAIWTDNVIFSIVSIVYICYKQGTRQLLLTHMPLTEESFITHHKPTIDKLSNKKALNIFTEKSTDTFDEPINIYIITLIPEKTNELKLIEKNIQYWKSALIEGYSSAVNPRFYQKKYTFTCTSPGGTTLMAILKPVDFIIKIQNQELIISPDQFSQIEQKQKESDSKKPESKKQLCILL